MPWERERDRSRAVVVQAPAILARSESRALVLLVALHHVAAPGRGRDVLLALEVSIDPVVVDRDSARVLERLEVTGDAVPVRRESGVLVVKQDIAGDARPENPCGLALHDLDATADPGPIADHDPPRVLGLHVADHPDAEGPYRGISLDLYRPFHEGAIELERRPIGNPEVVHRGRADRAPAHGLVGPDRFCRKEERPAQDQQAQPPRGSFHVRLLSPSVDATGGS